MQDIVTRYAAEIEAERGRPDIEEALSRWQAAGGTPGGQAGLWISVAFLFGRRLRRKAHSTS